jgi:hypothetical protein
MIQVQEILNSFGRYKRDISDVGSTLFTEWVQFTTRFIYQKVRGVDPSRFVKSQSYAVVLPPQKETLPTDYENMNQTVTGIFKYDQRKRLMVTFDETGDTDVTFSDTGGTSVYNSNIKVQGGSSRGFTGDGAATMNLSFGTNLNIEDFEDGGADSPNNDFISIYVYIGNSIPTSVTIEFSTLNTGADVGVNQLSYSETSLTAGWNRIKVAKSAFTLTGSADWGSLGYLRLIHTGGDSTTNIYWDKLQLLESEVNGNDEIDDKLSLTGYGSKNEGYYLEGSNIVFTHYDDLPDSYYVMKYLPIPPAITALTDYITVDGTADTAEIVRDQDLEYMVKAVDVLYEQWDDDPSKESIADFRFVRALGGLLDSYTRQPHIAQMFNPSSDY